MEIEKGEGAGCFTVKESVNQLLDHYRQRRRLYFDGSASFSWLDKAGASERDGLELVASVDDFFQPDGVAVVSEAYVSDHGNDLLSFYVEPDDIDPSEERI